jgi:hypothetical protein
MLSNSSASRCWSQGMKNSLTQQRKSGAAISHPFDQFQLVHFSLDEAV